MELHHRMIRALEERSWAGATIAEMRALLALFAGYSVVIEGQAGSGKNRIIGRYLLARSRSLKQIDIVGRPIMTLCPTRYLDVADLGKDENGRGQADVLWIDEANLHDLSGLERCHHRYNQIILTYSSDQGFILGEDVDALLKGRALYPVRLHQNIRTVRSGRAQLKDVIEDAPVYEPHGGVMIERRMFNLTRADEDPFSTALAVHMIAVRYANSGSPIIVVAHRPETLRFLQELGKQIPSPLMEIIHPDKIQGNDGTIFIYPTAEGTSRPLDIFDLEVVASRARLKLHLIVQGPVPAIFADPEFIHAPLSQHMSRFFDFVRQKGFVAEPRRHSVMLYDAVSFSAALLLVVYDNSAAPGELHECRRLLISALTRGLPATAVPVEILRNEYFREDDPRLLNALKTLVQPSVGYHHADAVLHPSAAVDLRRRM